MGLCWLEQRKACHTVTVVITAANLNCPELKTTLTTTVHGLCRKVNEIILTVSFSSNHICFSCLVLGGRLASTHFMFIFWTMWLGVGASLLNLEQTLPERRLHKLYLFTVSFALQIGRVKHVLKPVTYSCIISKLRCLGPH